MSQVEGQHQFGASVGQFDQWADGRLERLRGNRVADALFSSASHLGDFSLIWHIVGVCRAVTSKRRARQAVTLSLVLGVESLLVNQGVKRLFRRRRPTVTGDQRFQVRHPSTTSFPSGHATSAFVAATLLTTWGGKRSAPIWFAMAAVVATSRVYVRIHHASDVVGGVIVGLGLGALAKRVLKQLAPGYSR